MDLLEGGIRVPYIVRWPGRVPVGKTTAQLALTMDWMPTFLEAADVAPHPEYPFDGVSLLAVLEHPDAIFDRQLFWRMKFRDQKAMRSGRWKYLSIENDEFLFDLGKDTRERANLARRESERLVAMRARYEAWEATMPPIPADALASIPYSKSELAHPS
jgi:arylsulfatase A-like enzyme